MIETNLEFAGVQNLATPKICPEGIGLPTVEYDFPFLRKGLKLLVKKAH